MKPSVAQIKKKFARIARKRWQGLFSIGDPDKKRTVFLGKEATELQGFMKKLLGKRKELRGQPSSPGKVVGKARIILSQQDFHKMKKGDILIAPNTRPEYVPIMKIASAIVTEEGDLTCHAAIVSRELKIPAVVGVQGAIAALKDGGRIEVDAVKGMVRKLTGTL